MSETTSIPDEWLPVKDIARQTGISVARIYYLINHRKIVAELRHAGKDARILVVRARDVTEYVQSSSK